MTHLNPLHAELAALRDENDSLKAVLESLQSSKQYIVGTLAAHYGLSHSAARVLAMLAEGGVHHPQDIIAKCSTGEPNDYNWASVYICKLRKVLGYDAIRNHWGSGYSLTPEALAEVRRVIKGEAP